MVVLTVVVAEDPFGHVGSDRGVIKHGGDNSSELAF